MQSTTLLQQLRELVNNLVKVHPKAPCGYQDYLLVTRNYLLANQLSFATYVKRVSFFSYFLHCFLVMSECCIVIVAVLVVFKR